jgi:hypothetical protein
MRILPAPLLALGLLVESGGHMRAFRGRAYLPGLLPRALSAAVVR